jgi:hypothetical protein
MRVQVERGRGKGPPASRRSTPGLLTSWRPNHSIQLLSLPPLHIDNNISSKKNISTTIDCRDSGNISISLVESQHNHAHPTRSNLPSHDRVENLRIQVSHQTTRAMILEPGPPPGQGINSCLKPKVARLPDGRSASSIEENDKNTRRRR